MSLLTVTTPVATSDGSFTLDVPDGWQQGRGAYGGYVIASMIRAAQQGIGDGRALRSLTAQLCGPVVVGPATLKVELLREGSSVSTVSVRLLQEAALQAHAVCIFGKPRATDLDRKPLRPPPPLDVTTTPLVQVRAPQGPAFTQHFEFRTHGPLAWSSANEAKASGFIRPKDAGDDLGPAYVAACIDAWWPTLFPVVSAPRPMATIDFTLQLVSLPASNEPLRYEGKCLSVEGGYLIEHRELWTQRGELVALNQQTFAVIK